MSVRNAGPDSVQPSIAEWFVSNCRVSKVTAIATITIAGGAFGAGLAVMNGFYKNPCMERVAPDFIYQADALGMRFIMPPLVHASLVCNVPQTVLGSLVGSLSSFLAVRRVTRRL